MNKASESRSEAGKIEKSEESQILSAESTEVSYIDTTASEPQI